MKKMLTNYRSGSVYSYTPLSILRFYRLLLPGLFFFSCQPTAVETPEKEPHFFAEYFVRYLQTERQLKAYASFMEGDSLKTAQPKKFPAGVTFENKDMEFRNLGGRSFRYLINEDDKNYSNSFIFRHKDTDGDFWEYTIKMNPIEDFFIKESVIQKSEGMTLVINGGILKSNEQLILLFNDRNNKAHSIQIDGPSNDLEHRLNAENLAGLTKGPAKLYLVKKQINRDNEEQLTAVSSIEYYSKAIDILIE